MSLSRNAVLSALMIFSSNTLLAVELETVDQRFSYSLGVRFGQQLKAEGVNVDSAAFAAAVEDVIQGKELQLTQQQMSEAVQTARNAFVQKKKEQAQAAQEAGQKFLEENKKQEGVVVLPSGLQYLELAAGEGESPTKDSKVTVNYRGTLIDGTEFDSSYSRGQPASFKLDGVIPGFGEALGRMKPGAKWQVFIPSELGYGAAGAGSAIGPNETLIFEVELISVEAAAPAEK